MTNKSLNYDKYEGHTNARWEWHENVLQAYIGDDFYCNVLIASSSHGVPYIQILDDDGKDLIADAPLILQRCMELEDALTKLVFLHTCEMEGIASGQPTPKEWEDAIELASQALSKQREGE